jgi:hypothetical protein
MSALPKRLFHQAPGYDQGRDHKETRYRADCHVIQTGYKGIVVRFDAIVH